jgi:hypothetical protein
MTNMGRALGFRAEAKQIHWAVVEGTRDVPIVVGRDSIAAPISLDEAPSLLWYSSRVKLIGESESSQGAVVKQNAARKYISPNQRVKPLRLQ